VQPVGLEYAVILHDPELRRTLMKQPERRVSAGASSAQLDVRFKLVQALRSLVPHVDRRKRALDLAGPRQPASAQ
jgi:hypothetical protein